MYPRTIIVATEKGNKMSRDKQIEEMAKEICSEYDCVIPCQSCAYYGYADCRDVKSAEKLYNAGYRKASDVVPKSEVEKWKEINEQLHKEMSERILEERKIERKLVAREIFEEMEKNMVVFGDATLSSYFRGIGYRTFAELKKKYESENK